MDTEDSAARIPWGSSRHPRSQKKQRKRVLFMKDDTGTLIRFVIKHGV
jgi:hypothetical protein